MGTLAEVFRWFRGAAMEAGAVGSRGAYHCYQVCNKQEDCGSSFFRRGVSLCIVDLGGSEEYMLGTAPSYITTVIFNIRVAKVKGGVLAASWRCYLPMIIPSS